MTVIEKFKTLNLIFHHNLIPTISKPTQVTKNTTPAIDHIFKDTNLNNDFKTGIIKNDISNHFPIKIVIKKE